MLIETDIDCTIDNIIWNIVMKDDEYAFISQDDKECVHIDRVSSFERANEILEDLKAIGLHPCLFCLHLV